MEIRDIYFRLADKNDVLILAKMRWDFQNEFDSLPVCSEAEFTKSCSQFLCSSIDSANWFHWVVQDKSMILGMVSVYRIASIPKPYDLTPSWGYLTNTYVTPMYRNKGIGGALVHHVKEWAKNEGIELLIAWPSPKSSNFYAREGFKNNSELLELLL